MRIYNVKGEFNLNVGEEVYFKDLNIYHGMKKLKFLEGIVIEFDGMLNNDKYKPTFLPNDTHIEIVLKHLNFQQISLEIFFNNGARDKQKCFPLKVSEVFLKQRSI